MRIAEIAPPWLFVPPRGYGGTELVVDALVSHLAHAGHDVTLFASADPRPDAEVVTPLAAVGVEQIGAAMPEAHHALSAFLRARDFDVIHDHTLFGPALGALLGGVPPVVHTVHLEWTPDARRYYALLDRRVHLVAISAAQRRMNSGARYAATIHNGIDLDAYPLQTSRREDFLVYIGRADPAKAPELALEVAHRAGLPLKLIVKRATPDEQRYWEREVEPRLRDTDEVLFGVDHETKVDLLRRGRAFVFPIQWEEPFGLVMIEAMACGMPVVATPRGAASELVRDGSTGFLRPDLDGLVKAVGRTAEIDPATCRGWVEAEFSAETMVERYEQLFATLAGPRQELHGGVV
jgi:glycosyltransferase involved in cell wall biosynthesis